MTLRELFTDGDHRFQMALRRGPAAEFFRPTPDHARLIAERKRWLRSSNAPVYSACLPAGAPLVDECAELAMAWQSVSADEHQSVLALAAPGERCAQLGAIWEPDLLLLQRDTNGAFVLLAGCVCFPSAWSLAEKIGQSIEFVHGVVPHLNAQLGRPIHSVLQNLTPGAAWLRHNWGLTRSPELNQHPGRALPRLDASVALDEVWLRVEHQSLVALPRTGGVLFGIRIAMHPLAAVKEDEVAAQRLAQALRTMPETVATYKGLAPARERLLALIA